MRILSFFIVGLVFSSLYAQKHDYIWMAGYRSNPVTPNLGGMLIDFNKNPREVRVNYRNLDFGTVNTSICDSAGNLLFYSNGCFVAGADDSLLLNGDDISPGELHDQFCYDQYTLGYISGQQSILTLPLPNSANEYIIFHLGIENVPHPTFGQLPMATNFYYSRVRINHNPLKGEVIEKNVIIHDTVGFGEMCAVKHKNLRDWWILIPSRYDKNDYFVFCLTPDGLSFPSYQTFAFNTLSQFTDGQAQFTPDGNKYIRYRSNEGIYIFDFDRETGSLSNMIFLDPPEIELKYGGCAVAPNSRFLYVTNLTKVFQLDLEDPLNPASFQLVGTYDGYTDPLATNFGYCQLGPDCKLYIRPGNGTKVYHIIHNPDERGVACNLEQHGIVFPHYNITIPYFPNFRLGPPDDPGLPCSPVVSTTNPPTPLPAFSVFPNPVRAALKVVPNRQYHGPARLRLHDLTGRLALERAFDPLAPAAEVDVSALPPGVYVYEVWCEGAVQRSGKVVKVE